MEAQASGLPAIVSSEGGPRETVVDDVTGRVLSSSNPIDWCDAISSLLNDEPRRQRMGLAAIARNARFSLNRSFEQFWAEHVRAVDRTGHANPNIVVEFPGPSDASKQPASL